MDDLVRGVLTFAVVGGGSLIAIGVLLGREMRINPALLFGLPLLYETASKQASVAALEVASIFITESGTVSTYIGAAWRFALYHVCLLLGILAATRLLRPVGPRILRLRPASTAVWAAVAILFALALAAQIVNVVLSGVTVLPGSGVSRWAFWTLHAPAPWLGDVFGVLMVFIPFVSGTVYASARRSGDRFNMVLCGGLLVAYFAFLLLTGQRFHGFLVPLGVLWAIAAIHRVQRGDSWLRRRDLLAIPVLVAILVGYGVLAFADRGLSSTLGGPVAALGYRAVVLQGHTYWNADNRVRKSGPTGDASGLLSGLATITREVGTSDRQRAFEELGINFANSWPATSVLILGHGRTLLTSFAVGLLIGISYHLALVCVLEVSVLRGCLAAYLLLWAHTLYTRGSLESLADWKLWAFLLTFVALSLARHVARPLPAGSV